MLLNDVVKNVQNKYWTKINNFFIDIMFEPGINNAPGPINFSKMCGWDEITNEDLNTSLISVTTPQYQNALVNQYVSYEWRYHLGRDELYRFSMTFRDYDQMRLYNTFRTTYIKSRAQYFDKIKMSIKVYLDDDIGVDAIPVFQTSEAIIENVSQLQFSHNTENQIAEFSVNFVCNTNEVDGNATQNYGKTLGF